MSDFDEFVDCLSDATKQLFSDIEEAWSELKTDLRETVTVRYLRPGSVAYCRAEGKKYYGILTGTQIISLDAEGEPDYMDLKDFLELHDAEKIKVAGKNGSRSVRTRWILPPEWPWKRSVSPPRKPSF